MIGHAARIASPIVAAETGAPFIFSTTSPAWNPSAAAVRPAAARRVYQSPGPAYGVIPRFTAPTPSAGILIAGVSILLFGADNLLDIFQTETYQLNLAAHGGKLQQVDLVVGSDAEDTDRVWRDPATLVDIGGRVTLSSGQ